MTKCVAVWVGTRLKAVVIVAVGLVATIKATMTLVDSLEEDSEN